jgi:hypothetical protein
LVGRRAVSNWRSPSKAAGEAIPISRIGSRVTKIRFSFLVPRFSFLVSRFSLTN